MRLRTALLSISILVGTFFFDCDSTKADLPSPAPAPSPDFAPACHWKVGDGSRPSNKAGIICSDQQEWFVGAILHCERMPFVLDFVEGRCAGERETCRVTLKIDSQIFNVTGDAYDSDTGEWSGVAISLQNSPEIVAALSRARRLVVHVETRPATDLTLPNITETLGTVARSCGYDG